jgi:glycosyltransferase involved in cell wall biosynthesis
LPAFITLLFDTLESNHHEIIFVNRGSNDDSRKIIQANPSYSLIYSKKGRAIQINTGAKNAHFPLLYFIHVDSIPPKGFDQILLHQFKQGRKAGCFQMQFDHDHVALNWSAFATRPHYLIPTNNAIDNCTCIFFSIRVKLMLTKYFLWSFLKEFPA